MWIFGSASRSDASIFRGGIILSERKISAKWVGRVGVCEIVEGFWCQAGSFGGELLRGSGETLTVSGKSGNLTALVCSVAGEDNGERRFIKVGSSVSSAGRQTETQFFGCLAGRISDCRCQ